MKKTLKKYNLVDKILIIAIMLLTAELCLPHYTQAQEQLMANSKMGPVYLTLKDNSQELKNQEIVEYREKQPTSVRWVTVTAYSSTVDQCDDTPFISANGSWVYDGMVAANFLPFGTKVKFPDYFGDQVFTVEDRMNTKYNSRIDVWMPTREQAQEFGVRYLKVEIYQ